MTGRAVIDLGSVSSKLLVVDTGGRLRRSLDTIMGGSAMSMVGAVTGRPFGDEALERVDGALTEFGRVLAERGLTGDPSALTVVGTAGARSATDLDRLRALVRDRLSVELTVLSGDDEARLGFLGAVSDPALAGTGPVVTLDLGGASTEVATGTVAAGVGAGRSLPIGGRLLSATYLHADPPAPEELSAALSVVELHVDDVRREVPPVIEALGAGAPMLATGAVITVAAVEIGLLDDPLNGPGDGPVHGFVLGRDAVEDVFRTVATEAADDRRHNPGLPASRVHDIVGSCGLLVEVMRRLDVGQVVVSQRGLADGVLAAAGPTARG
ncbi:MAG: Ppx/GppA phosphatase family protein [Acidimicrobiales bacterium]